MSKKVMSGERSRAFQILTLPVTAIVILTLFLLVFKGVDAGYSTLLGGLVWVIPNFYFAQRIFVAKPAKQLIGILYRAEVTKLLLSAVLFVIVIKFLAMTVLFVLITYLMAQLLFWLTILFYLGLNVR